MCVNSKTILLYRGAFLLWLAHVALTFLAPKQDSTPLHISEFVQVVLQVTFVVPYLFTWLLGCYGGLSLNAYAKNIQDPQDRLAVSRIATGIFILLAGLIFTTLVGSLRTYLIAPGSQFIPTWVIAMN